MNLKHRNEKDEFSSFKILKFFLILFGILVVIGFSARLYNLAKGSKFNDDYFTLLLIESKANIININRHDSQIHILTFDDATNFKNFKSPQQAMYKLGIPIDAIVSLKTLKIDVIKSAIKSPTLAFSLFYSEKNAKRQNFNELDMVKLVLISNLLNDKISFLKSRPDFFKTYPNKYPTELNFKNSRIINLKRTVEVINSSSYNGVAAKFSNVFSGMGYNIIATKTMYQNEKAKIIYRLEYDDTVAKLENLLDMKGIARNEASIADISVIIDDEYIDKYHLLE